MFSPFFYLLRQRGLKVSLTEWLTFVDAMRQGLASESFSGLYYLARSLLVKTEADFDKFDSVFLEFFKDMPPESDELPKELLEWLDKPDVELVDRGRGRLFMDWSNDAIGKMFQERLKEQKEEHNGGTYWIGTGGASPFGNSGESLKGIRVGGQSRRRVAMEVAGERKYRDFRDDNGVNIRSFQTAFRRLRQFSARVDAPRSELNIDSTIRATCDNAGGLKLVFDKPRKNTVKLMLLIDSGGSMDPYSSMCTALFQAVSKSNHFKDLKVYYFHNCFKRLFYHSPMLDMQDAISARWILDNIDSDYKVIVIGDALMDTYELLGTYHFGTEEVPRGLGWLKAFQDRYPRMIWYLPFEREPMVSRHWGYSYELIKKEIDIRPMTVETLTDGIKKLMVAR